MSWLGALGGIGRGIAEGAGDLERIRDAQWRQAERERVLKERAEEDRVARELRGIKPAGEYDEVKPQQYDNPDQYFDEEDRAATFKGLQQNMPTGKKTTRTTAEVERDRARVFSGAQGLRYQQLARESSRYADEEEERATARKNATAQRAIAAASMVVDSDPIQASRMLGQAYEMYGLGKVNFDFKNNAAVVTDLDGNPTGKPIPLTPDAMKMAIMQAHKHLNPDVWEKHSRVGQTDRQLGQNDRRLTYDERHGDARIRQGDEELALKDRELGLRAPVFAAQARYYDANAALDRARASWGSGGGRAGGAGGRTSERVITVDAFDKATGRLRKERVILQQDGNGGYRAFDAGGREITDRAQLDRLAGRIESEDAEAMQLNSEIGLIDERYKRGHIDSEMRDAEIQRLRGQFDLRGKMREFRELPPEARPAFLQEAYDTGLRMSGSKQRATEFARQFDPTFKPGVIPTRPNPYVNQIPR